MSDQRPMPEGYQPQKGTEAGPQQPIAPQALNNYLVRCLNGWSIYVASPMDLASFWTAARANGYIASDKMAINLAAIASVEYVGPFVPRQNVTPLDTPHLHIVP